jgi:hypothetical protein
MQPRKRICMFSFLFSQHVSALAGPHQVSLAMPKLLTPDDGQLGPKHVVKKEKKEHTNTFSRLHCDGNSVIVCKIMQQDCLNIILNVLIVLMN